MNDEEKKVAEAIIRDLPPQQSATDTSNWDDKNSVDPSGDAYIRTTDDEDGE